ncbi:glycosyltransferase family 1 protein [Paenibacillaceae bacterium]|nr:glycosyltransferase family 1 protein [Paenibacillaceae bacterium]
MDVTYSGTVPVLKICMVSEEEIGGPRAMIPGGIGQYILRCAKLFAERNHHVTIVCMASDDFHIVQEGIEWVGLSTKGRSWDLTIYRWLRKQHFDVIEFPEWGGQGALSALLLPRRSGAVVTRGHGHSLLVQRAHGKRLKRGRQHMKEWMQLKLCRGILANSLYLKEEFMRDFGLRAKAVDTCHIGVDPAAIGNDRNLMVEFNGPVIAYVGGLDRRKGPELLLHIVATAKKLRSDLPVKLIMVGQDTPTGPDGTSYREHCLRTIKELGIDDQVHILPPKPRKELFQVYHQASVFVSATRAESFGIPYIEAMSIGLPVVTWNTGAAGELVVPGSTGFLPEYGEVEQFARAILTLVEDKELWQKMSKKAAARVRQAFTQQRLLDEQLLWYSSKIYHVPQIEVQNG